MLRILTGFFSLILLSCFGSPALAADKLCPQRETILAFSDIVLADWATFAPTASYRYGAASPTLAADLEIFGIVTELLLAKGDQEALRAFVQQAPSGETRLAVANDFAMRLDRACAAYLYHPGEAFTLGRRPIFKFDTE